MHINLPSSLAAAFRGKLCLFAAAFALFPAFAWSQEFTVTDLGTLGGSTSTPMGVNNSGQVVGSADLKGNSKVNPFLYSNGKMTDLFSGGSPYGGVAVAVNNNGQIVANFNLAKSGDPEALLYNGVNWVDITGGPVVGINDSETVLGGSPNTGGYWLYSNSQLNTAPPQVPNPVWGPINYLFPQAINNAGQVAALCYDNNGDEFRCVLSSSSTVALENGWVTNNLAINSDGETCGEAPGPSGDLGAAYWASNGTLTNLWTVDHQMFCCNGLDNYDDGVGYLNVLNSNRSGVLNSYALAFDPLNGARNLNKLISQSSPNGHSVEVLNAVAISNTGYIAASCVYSKPHVPSKNTRMLAYPEPGPHSEEQYPPTAQERTFMQRVQNGPDYYGKRAPHKSRRPDDRREKLRRWGGGIHRGGVTGLMDRRKDQHAANHTSLS